MFQKEKRKKSEIYILHHHLQNGFGKNLNLNQSSFEPWRIVGDLSELTSSQPKFLNKKKILLDKINLKIIDENGLMGY